MTTTTDIPSTEKPAGCISRVIVFSSGVYLIFMVAYLILRLIFFSDFWWLALLNAFAVYTFLPVFVLLPLALMARLWRMVIRLGLLAVLAIIWFGPFFQPNSINPTGAPTITIATFNMEQNYGGFPDNVDAFTAWLEENEVDILVLQETPRRLEEIDEIGRLLDAYPEQVIQNGNESEQSRLAILSRYPLKEVTSGEQYMRTVVDFDGRDVILYNVHFVLPFNGYERLDLDSTIGWIIMLLKYDESSRNEQIDAFLEIIAEETTPHIVAGDFNTSQHSIIYSSIAVMMKDSFRIASSGLGATWPSQRFGPLVPPMLRIDYVWYSEPLRAITADVGPHVGSDHLPYVATLELPEIAINADE